MKVLFAIDDSSFSDAALRSVGKRPWADGTEFMLLSVVELGRHEYEGLDASTVPNLKPLEEKVVADVKAYLEGKVNLLSELQPGKPISVKVLQGHVKDVILQEAASWGAGYLVVGSHGRKGIRRFLLGSVAESILGHAPCPVEIVKVPDSEA